MKNLLLPILTALVLFACHKEEFSSPKATVYYTDAVVFSATASACTQTAAGDLVFSGVSNGFLCITKLSATGNLLWTKQYSIPNGQFTGNTAVVEDDEQNLYASAKWQGGPAVIKVNSSGDFEWKNYLGALGNEINGLIYTNDGNLLLLASKTNSGLNLIKIAKNSNVVWKKTYIINLQQATNHLLETPQGDYIVTASNINMDELAYLKVDVNGDVYWDKTNTVTGLQMLGNTIVLPDGSLATCGSITNDTGNLQSFVYKADVNGNGQWLRSYTGPNAELTRYITAAPNGGFLLTGQSTNQTSGRVDGHLLSVSATGDRLGLTYFASSINISPSIIIKLGNGDNLIAGASNKDNTTAGIFITYTDANGNFK